MKCGDCKTYHHEWCVIKEDSPDPDLERNCDYFVQTTNVDRIRAMTDEELADFLQDVAMQGGIELGGRLTTWLEWLRQEATP